MNESKEVLLITGATGYIGSQLARHFIEKKQRVRAIIRKSSDRSRLPASPLLEIFEVSDKFENLPAAFEKHDVRAVFHLASHAMLHHTPSDIPPLLEANVTFGVALLEAICAAPSTVLINTGSYWQTSHDSGVPNSFYAATKQAFESFIDYYTLHGLRAVTLRLTDVYGETDSRPKLLNFVKGAARTGTSISMTPGNQLISFVHIDDVVQAYECALAYAEKAEVGHAVYTVAVPPISLREAMACFEKVSKTSLNLCWGDKPYPQGQIMNPKMDSLLPGWRAQISLEEGLRRIIAHG